MNTLPIDGKSLIVQSVGTKSAWDFFKDHGVTLSRKTDLSGITHAVFVHDGDLVAAAPKVVFQDVVSLDQENIAKRALSNDLNERRIGVALMQAAASGFKHQTAGLFVLSEEEGELLAFKANQAKNLLGRTEVQNRVINTLLRAG